MNPATSVNKRRQIEILKSGFLPLSLYVFKIFFCTHIMAEVKCFNELKRIETI